MKFIFIIIFLVIAYLLEKRLINKKPFEEYRNNCITGSKQNLYNKYIYKPEGSNWYNKIISGYQGLLNYKPQCQEDFINPILFSTRHDGQLTLNNKPNLWIYLPDKISSKYWDNFGTRLKSQDLSAYKQLCLNTVFKYNKHMNIYLLNDEKINNIFSKKCPFNWNDKRINKNLKLDYLKYYLFYHYGGIWIPPETIVFQSFKPFTNKLLTKEIITIGCKPNIENCSNFTILGGSKKSQIIKYILNNISSRIYQYINDYSYDSYFVNKLLLNSNISYLSHHFSNEYDGSVNIKDIPITYENLVSINKTTFKNIDNLVFYRIPENIEKYNHYNWFARLNKDQILLSDMWIGKIFSV